MSSYYITYVYYKTHDIKILTLRTSVILFLCSKFTFAFIVSRRKVKPHVILFRDSNTLFPSPFQNLALLSSLYIKLIKWTPCYLMLMFILPLKFHFPFFFVRIYLYLHFFMQPNTCHEYAPCSGPCVAERSYCCLQEASPHPQRLPSFLSSPPGSQSRAAWRSNQVNECYSPHATELLEIHSGIFFLFVIPSVCSTKSRCILC